MGTEKLREEIQVSPILGEGGNEEFETGTPKGEEGMKADLTNPGILSGVLDLMCKKKTKSYRLPEMPGEPVAHGR